jgi:hypothetical protein
MKITPNNEKINFILISSKTFTFLFAFTFLLFFFSFGFHIIIIPASYANLDTFSAKGTIFLPIADSNIQLPSLSSTSNITSANTISTIDTIKGQWNIKVNKGVPQAFDMILVSYNKNNIPQNAYGIFNLRDVNFIQLNNQGSEIINGKVDVRSVGQTNETITGIDATLIIERLQNIQIILESDTELSNNYYYHIFNKPVIGKTVLMADGIDKLLVDKRQQQKISTTPIPAPTNHSNKYQGSVPIPTPFSYDSSTNNIPRSLSNNAPPASTSSTMPPAANSPNTIR